MKATRITIALIGASIVAACNVHPVDYVVTNIDTGGSVLLDVGQTTKLDLLWVIDNSGSMCEEQRTLRENFDRFVEQLDGAALDFQMGVTTTHMAESYPLEPVARPGYLQSTPQPLPGFDPTCLHGVDAQGNPDPQDWSKVRELIEVAVSCMAQPNEALLNATDADIECAVGCAGSSDPNCEVNLCGVAVFPREDEYRVLPKVLKSSDYLRADGTLDIDAMKADFRCMSFVGMRGYGIEQGLGALNAAVSPRLTGGAVEAAVDVSAPNHGLIRRDADFAAILVTDENDCTHDGRLDEASACGGDVCEYWNREGLEDSPLIEPDVLRDELLTNLQATKGRDDFGLANVLVASVHGVSSRYAGPVTPTPDCAEDSSCAAFSSCGDESLFVESSCVSDYGTAYSGDRYERFLRSFPDGQTFPEPGPNGEITGWMCSGNFRPALAAIGDFLSRRSSGCITDPVQTCDPDLQLGSPCPDHASGEPGVCASAPNSDRYFCDSFVEVRVLNAEASRAQLEAAGFCDAFVDGSCVLSPQHYALNACTGDVSGFVVEWQSPAAVRQALEGYDVEMRWRAAGHRIVEE